MDDKKNLSPFSISKSVPGSRYSTSSESSPQRFTYVGDTNLDEFDEGVEQSEVSEVSFQKDEIDGIPSLIDANSSFVAEFSEGYTFRNMIEYLRVTNTKGNFRFSRDLIYYEQVDADNTILNQIEIQTCELSHYEINTQNEEIIIGINISDMRSITKTIGKKDSVRLFKHANDPFLYIQIISQSSRNVNRQNVSIVRPQHVEMFEYDIPEYQNDEKSPNCTIPTADFAKTCTSMSSVKCSYVTIYGLPKGLILEGFQEGSMFGRREQFGNCEGYVTSVQSSISSSTSPPIKSDIRLNIPSGPKPRLILKTPLVKIKVKMTIIKALAKLNNLSAMGTLKVYSEKETPVKFVSKIGGYGILRSYARSFED